MLPKQFVEFAVKQFKNQEPFLVVGPPGVGKTDLIQLATKRAKMGLIVSHPAVSSPIDYKGLPMPGKNGDANFVPIGDLRRIVEAKKPTVFFMDDIGQASVEVQKALMQLFRARQVGEHKVSDHVTFCGATNAAEHRAGVGQMLEPVKSRFATIVKLETDVDQWIEWALDGGIQPAVVAFIMWKRNLLHDFQPSPGLTNSPCPRTVENVSKELACGHDPEILPAIVEGAAGKGFATEFCAFLQVYSQLPDVKKILEDPDTVQIPSDRPDIAYALTTSAADAVETRQMNNFVKLLEKFDKPVEVLGMLLLKERGVKFQETPAFVKWAQRNQDYLF